MFEGKTGTLVILNFILNFILRPISNAAGLIYSLFQDNDESFHRNKTGNKLRLSDNKSVTDGGIFHCQVGNIIGTSSVSQAVTVTVEGT